MKPFFYFVLLACSLWGAPVGNPAAPAIMNTGFFSAHNPFIKGTTGYIADYVTNKQYQTDKKNASIDLNDPMKDFIIHSQLASFSIILLERLEMFGTVGGSKERLKSNDTEDNSPFTWDFHSSYQFSWSTGVKIVLIQWGQTFLGTDFTYFAIPESPHSYFKFFNRLNLPMEFEKQETSLSEWQMSLGLSSRIFFFTPYAGGTYLKSKLQVAQGPDIGHIEYTNRFNWGYFYGITLSLSGRFHLNFEQRFRGENGYTFSTIAVF